LSTSPRRPCLKSSRAPSARLDLAEAFGEDFAKLLAKGESPFKSAGIDFPTPEKVSFKMGFAPKYAACETYGRSPGLAGWVGGKIGLPPEWTDNGPKKGPNPQ
jgi:hypothetical protein